MECKKEKGRGVSEGREVVIEGTIFDYLIIQRKVDEILDPVIKNLGYHLELGSTSDGEAANDFGFLKSDYEVQSRLESYLADGSNGQRILVATRMTICKMAIRRAKGRLLVSGDLLWLQLVWKMMGCIMKRGERRKGKTKQRAMEFEVLITGGDGGVLLLNSCIGINHWTLIAVGLASSTCRSLKVNFDAPLSKSCAGGRNVVVRQHKEEVQENPAGGPSTSTCAAADLDSEDDVPDLDDDDDELDMDELNELEASLSRTSIQIKEPGIETSS
ncbi:hypothetical protein Acr_03g0013720 [Actinidia rufa]|uniref:Uncharacterized protein n=1 Tax=Actinidia rufa TaxID=165716 RepID=A0A7J0EDP3_9ERIC|nr:hypothetical protein Acr_03g0013720 [Actinidia rufa]